MATLAVGIGATAAVYGVVGAVLVRPLPFERPEELAVVWPNTFVGNRTVDFLRDNGRSYAAVGSFSPGWTMTLSGVETPARVEAARVSGNLWALLGVRPRLGRAFGMDAERPGGAQEAVLTWEAWHAHFGGDPGVLGRAIRLDGDVATVVGILPPGFAVLNARTDLYLPLAMDADDFTWDAGITLAIARLAPGATLDGANRELTTLVARMRSAFGEPDGWGAGARVADMKEQAVQGARPMLLVLLGAVAFILLAAAANVANLLLVRATERRTELAVRLSLGATPWRLARLQLAEGLVLAAVGGAAGLALAFAGVRVLRAILPPGTPRLGEVGMSGDVVVVAAAVTLGAGVLLSLAPALLASRRALEPWLRRGRAVAGGGRARGPLVAVEVALSLVLVAGATLMGRTLRALYDVDPGFRADAVLTLQLHPAGLADDDARAAYWRDVVARVEAVPGVAAAATVMHLPLAGRRWTGDLAVDGRPLDPGASPPRVSWQAVTAGYFDVLGIPVVRGRALADADRAGAPRVAVIDETLAAQIFPDEDPIGRRIVLDNATGGEPATIVGVVGAVHHDGVQQTPPSFLYVPAAQAGRAGSWIVARTRARPETVADAVVAAVRGVRAEVPVTDVRPMSAVIAQSVRQPRLVLGLLGAFSLIALALGAIGIYGVVAYGARLRAREIGIRVALGARRGGIAGLLVRDGLGWAALGVAVGVPVALVLSRFLRTLVFGIEPTDPGTFIAVPLLLLLVAALAAALPARRAAAADPALVLRE